MLTSDAAISAIGDVAAFPSSHIEGIVRLECVQNAVDQARNVATRLMGKPVPYAALPWFWSDQGDLKLQIAGLSPGHDQTVVLGNAATRQLTVLCFKEGKLLAVETCNMPANHMTARKILSRASALTPAVAAGRNFNLKEWEAAN